MHLWESHRELCIAGGSAVVIFLLLFGKRILWRLLAVDAEVNRILTQKKSSEVRLGKISEVLAPILSDFPVDVRKAGTTTVFLGQPVDYVHFDPDEGVTFIEVKSGEASLSSSQRKIKDLIAAGRVRWKEIRVSDNALHESRKRKAS